MITILHGDNIEASRAELLRLKKLAGGKEIRQLDGKHLDTTSLVQSLESSSLLGGGLLVIIENFLSSLGKKSKAKDAALAQLRQSAADTEVVLWESKQIELSALKAFAGVSTEKLFKTPVVLFAFLDALGGQPLTSILTHWQALTETEPGEIVHVMIVRRIRELIMAKDGLFSPLLAPWQRGKLTKQADSFTLEKLLAMERHLLGAEYLLKSGGTPFTLKELLEQFLVGHFS